MATGWRQAARDLQDAVLSEFQELDDAAAVTTSIDPGDGGPIVPVRAIFLDPDLEVLLENQVPASTREIRADVAIEELPTYPLPKTARFLIKRPMEGDPVDDSQTTTFEITRHAPDGEGMVRLHLRGPRAPRS